MLYESFGAYRNYVADTAAGVLMFYIDWYIPELHKAERVLSVL